MQIVIGLLTIDNRMIIYLSNYVITVANTMTIYNACIGYYSIMLVYNSLLIIE